MKLDRDRGAPRRFHAGLSLVEMMVAMAIGLALLAGISYFYLGNRQTFRALDDLSRIQETYRYALELISNDIRQAGYSGCANITALPPPGQPAAQLAPAGHVLRQSIRGYPGAPVWPGPGAAPAGYVPNTEVIEVVRADVRGVQVTGLTGAAIPVAANPAGLVAGRDAVIADCSHVDVFAIQAASGTSLTPAAPLQKTYGIGAEVFPLSQTVYYIAVNPSGVPALYRRNNGVAEELAENVENLVVRFGVDTNNDYRTDLYQAAPAVADWRQVMSVRVNLVLRGGSRSATGVAPCTVEGLDCAAADGVLRQVATSTATLRNRVP